MLSSDGHASDRQRRLSLENPGDETVPGAGGGATPVEGTDLMERVLEAENLRRAVRQARPVIPVEDAIRVELEAMAWRDGLRSK